MERKHEIEAVMEKRGYSKIMEAHKGENVESITFILDADNKVSSYGLIVPTYSVTVFMEDEEFQFTYSSAKSINKLVSPKCSSFMMQEHFDRIARAFEREASALYSFM